MTAAVPEAATRTLTVLVVDDSVVVRQVVVRALTGVSLVGRVDVAASGPVAIAKIERTHPDAVVLDVEMPTMDGIAAHAAIRSVAPKLPIVMFSRHERSELERRFGSAFDDATGYVQKPTSPDEPYGAVEAVRSALLPEISRLTRIHGAPGQPAQPRAAALSLGPPLAVVVAASTGGPDALAELVTALPSTLDVPVLIVQHIPDQFSALLAQRLDRLTPLSVRRAEQGDVVAPGTVVLAPGGRHLTIEGTRASSRVVLVDGPKVNSCRPAADLLFLSAVTVFGGRLAAVVLTGMGQDGRDGSRAVHDAGGTVLAQDVESSAVSSMPAAVADIASYVARPAALAARIGRLVSGVLA
jgi:two-component system chemotaxis response regulator CheB